MNSYLQFCKCTPLKLTGNLGIFLQRLIFQDRKDVLFLICPILSRLISRIFHLLLGGACRPCLSYFLWAFQAKGDLDLRRPDYRIYGKPKGLILFFQNAIPKKPDEKEVFRFHFLGYEFLHIHLSFSFLSTASNYLFFELFQRIAPQEICDLKFFQFEDAPGSRRECFCIYLKFHFFRGLQSGFSKKVFWLTNLQFPHFRVLLLDALSSFSHQSKSSMNLFSGLFSKTLYLLELRDFSWQNYSMLGKKVYT